MYKTAQYDKLPHERILEVVDDYTIWQRFYPFTPGKNHRSPLRDDKSPSFSIFKGRNGRWNYKDLSTGEHGDVFSFLERYLSRDYYEVCSVISTEFKLGILKPIVGYKKLEIENIAQMHTEPLKRAKIDFIEKPFTKLELNYWNKYGITEEILETYNVKSCSKVYIDNYLWRMATEKEPIFIFINKRTGAVKVYRPTSKYKTSKWRSTQSNDSDIGGYDQLPKTGDLLIFQKALKEVMCLYSMDYASCCTQAEGYSVNPDFFKHLKKRFKRIVLMYDNDPAGCINCQRLAELNKLECVYTPDYKNISDYYEHEGKEESIKLMKKLLK